MGKLNNVLGVSAVIVALVVYQQTINDLDVEPEVMPEDVWWAPESDRTNDDGNTDIQQFRINISDTVRNEDNYF